MASKETRMAEEPIHEKFWKEHFGQKKQQMQRPWGRMLGRTSQMRSEQQAGATLDHMGLAGKSKESGFY